MGGVLCSTFTACLSTKCRNVDDNQPMVGMSTYSAANLRFENMLDWNGDVLVKAKLTAWAAQLLGRLPKDLLVTSWLNNRGSQRNRKDRASLQSSYTKSKLGKSFEGNDETTRVIIGSNPEKQPHCCTCRGRGSAH